MLSFIYRLIPTSLCLCISLPCLAESSIYQTTPKPAPVTTRQDWQAPVISVNPDNHKTRVFITPESAASSWLAPNDTQVYHARTLLDPTPAGIPAGITKLYQQMAAACPQGWIKRQEWAILKSNTPELHYQFQCLNAPQQD